MLSIFAQIKSNFKLKPQSYYIDNWVFQLHYRISTLIYLVATVLVTSRQYIGEHIKCISDSGVPDHVMNTFCFFTTTFTVIKDYDVQLVEAGHVPHPGVGPYAHSSTEPVRIHAYYQWVPFVLFGQAVMFHCTHLLWKKLEGGRIRRLIDGLRYAAFSLCDREVSVGSAGTIPTMEHRQEQIKRIKRTFIERVYINRTWSAYLVLCEVLNVLNVLLQFYLTNQFLGEQFYRLGMEAMDYGLDSAVSVLDEVFPKVTKCTFHKYGPSGSIQLHDAMCVMALNIINEKIYIFLWFWLVFLLIASAAGLVWRLATLLLHARSKKFNQLVFATSCPGKLNPWRLLTVTKHCNFTDWLFLKYISKNLDGMVFRELFVGLAEDLDDKRPLVTENSSLSDEENPSGAATAPATLEKNAKFD